jgi:hypothetical protein
MTHVLRIIPVNLVWAYVSPHSYVLQRAKFFHFYYSQSSVCPSVRLSVHLSIYLSIYLSMAVQPFVEPWPFFSFLILHTVGRTPWTVDQPVARHLPIHRINAHRHPRLGWDSNQRLQCSSGRRRLML